MKKINEKLKLMIIVGTRPEIIRLSEVIKKCDKYFNTILVNTGQNYNYELNEIFFKDLKLRQPDYQLHCAGKDLGETQGNILKETYKLMVKEKPEAVLVLGDTNSCLSAINAKRLHIPLFHMEAGNRCKDEMLPEETNRRIVDVISDVNLPYSERARDYLIEMGFPKERIFVTGSPMTEVLDKNLDKINKSTILKKLGLKKNGYILLSAHREENIDNEKNFLSLFNAINALAKEYDMPIIYSCHPRSDKMLKQRNFELDKRVKKHKPLGFIDYNNLQMNAFCVVSDSGTLPEESSYFLSINKSFPAICIRTSTERPEALETGNFILAGIEEKSLIQAIEVAVEMNKNMEYGTPALDYKDNNISNKVVRVIESYSSIISKK